MPLMFLNGGAMRGGPLHHLLRGAPFIGTVRTAPRYRFYSVGDRFPMLAEQDPKITGPSNGSGPAEVVAGSPAEVAVGNPAEMAAVGGSAGFAAGGVVGVSVVGELYDVPWDVLRESLLPAEPEELELGIIELEDGSGALAMIRRRTYAESDVTFRDISEHADWNAYTASRASTASAASGSYTGNSTGE
jgi:hypothetical protein